MTRSSEPGARALMVWPVKSVAAETPVAEACALMDRYLIGAVPVLAGGTVVGILTRRLAGGVAAHGLGEVPCEAVMLDARTVGPEASLSDLSALVREHSPKLVPVVEEGALVGVITRTAILLALVERPLPEAEGRVSLEGLREDLKPIVSRVSRLADELEVVVSMVGGIVRDLLLGVENDDLDLLVEGESGAVGRFIERLTAELAARRLDHSRFGTAVLELDSGLRVDVATARIETYGQPAALPTVEPGSLWLDLRRRDFTINSLAIRLDGQHLGTLLDPFGGRRDLKAGRIRVLHGLSFLDDPTRIFRAIRFEQRFGFSIEPQTGRLLGNAVRLGLVEKLSSERLSAEVELLLTENSCARSIRRMSELHLLPSLRLAEPGVAQLAALDRALEAVALVRASHERSPLPGPVPPVWQVRLMVLLAGQSPEAVHGALARLAVRGPAATRILHACREIEAVLAWLEDPAPRAPSEIVGRLEPAGVEGWLLAAALAGSQRAAERLRSFLERYRAVRSPLDGGDLMRLGRTPGPHFKAILRVLRDRALDAGLTREQAVEMVRAWPEAAAPGGTSGS